MMVDCKGGGAFRRSVKTGKNADECCGVFSCSIKSGTDNLGSETALFQGAVRLLDPSLLHKPTERKSVLIGLCPDMK